MENIKFEDLSKFEDNGGWGIVYTALIVTDNDKESTIKAMNECKLMGLLRDGTEVIDILKIVENVKGERGRSDMLIVLNNFGVNPVARLTNCPDVKWIEDFVKNFKADYIAGGDEVEAKDDENNYDGEWEDGKEDEEEESDCLDALGHFIDFAEQFLADVDGDVPYKIGKLQQGLGDELQCTLANLEIALENCKKLMGKYPDHIVTY